MRQKFGRHIKSFIPALCDRMAEVDRVPIDDDGGEQVEAGDPVMLALGGSATDFFLAADTQSIVERVVGLTLVEADLGTPLHVGVGDPLYNKRLSAPRGRPRVAQPPDRSGVDRRQACGATGSA